MALSDLITPDYVDPDGETFTRSEIEDRYDEMLSDVYGDVNICGMEYDAARALYDVDPIAYRCGFVDYVDSLMADDELDEWREDHPWIVGEDDDETDDDDDN